MIEDRDERIEQLLRREVPKLQIARRLGIARDTVDRVAARVGFPAARRGDDDRNWAEIRRFYEAGNTAAECMRRFGFKAATWEAAIGRGEITPRPRASAQLAPGERRREVKRLLDQGLGIGEVAERLGVSKPTVCYHARKLGVPARGQLARRYDWDAIARVYNSGVSLRECRRRFGFSQSAWDDAIKRGAVIPRDHLIPMEELLVRGRPTNRGHLKGRLLTAGLKENRCEECGLTDWRGRPIGLELHHRNGDGQDNRLPNLQILCPNCHAQTDTWGGRNGHRKPGSRLKLVKPPNEEAA